jgi:hypothetical protein
MTINEKERVLIFKRIIKDSDNSFIHSLTEKEDSFLLEILNSTILPNSISHENLKYTFFFNMIINGKTQNLKKIEKNINKIKDLFYSMSKSQKDIIRFGLFNGYKIFNWRLQMNNYISNSSNPLNGGELEFKKKISSFSFSRFFPFAFNIINRGEKNERFPKF